MSEDLPHAGKQLDKAAVAESERNGDVGCRNISCVHVYTRQDKGSQGESTETQRCRVGKLAVLIRLPGTGLESTTEGSGVALGFPVANESTVLGSVSGGSIFIVVLSIGRRDVVNGNILLRGRRVGNCLGSHCVDLSCCRED